MKILKEENLKIKEGLPQYSKTRDKYFRFKFWVDNPRSKELELDKTYFIIEMIETSPANEKKIGVQYILYDEQNLIPSSISIGDKMSRIPNTNMSFREIYEVVDSGTGQELSDSKLRITNIVKVQYD